MFSVGVSVSVSECSAISTAAYHVFAGKKDSFVFVSFSVTVKAQAEDTGTSKAKWAWAARINTEQKAMLRSKLPREYWTRVINPGIIIGDPWSVP